MDPAEAALQQLGVSKEEYIEYAAQSIDGKRLLHACLTLLLWDYVLTLRQEVVDVWTQGPRFSLAKILFGLNRYYPILNYIVRVWALNLKALNDRICNVGLGFTGWSSVINFAIVEIVLMMRVWALYDKSKRIGAFLGLLFLACLASSFALRKVHPKGLHLVTPPPVSLTHCVRSTAEEYFFLYVIGLVVETTIFILLVSRAWRYSLGKKSTPLTTALLRHGAMYYSVVIVTLALVMASTFSHYLYRPIADSNLIVAITSIACNRLILSLRGLYFKSGAIETSADITAPSDTVVGDIDLHHITGGRVNARPGHRHLHHVSTFTEDGEEGGLSISQVGKHA